MDKCIDCGKDISSSDRRCYGGRCFPCYKIFVEARDKQALLDNEETETYGKDEITCPWCGESLSDSWEITADDGYVECGCCEKVFLYERHTEVTYSSERVPYGMCTECGARDVGLLSQGDTIGYTNVCTNCVSKVEKRLHEKYYKSITTYVINKRKKQVAELGCEACKYFTSEEESSIKCHFCSLEFDKPRNFEPKEVK